MSSILPLLTAAVCVAALPAQENKPREDATPSKAPKTENKALDFETFDKHAMRGRLVLPRGRAPRAIVVYVQCAEGMTIDMQRALSKSKSFRYFDLYREKLPALGLGFFSYEGRGITMGPRPPRFEKIDWDIYNTSTLENKVRDALSAVAAVRAAGHAKTPIYLMGASEGTLLAAEAASRAPDQIQGLALYGVLANNLRDAFAFIMGRGQFLQYEKTMDRDGDKRVTREEWDAATEGKVPFTKADLDGDGVFTVEDLKSRTKHYLDAIRDENFRVLQSWAKNFGGTAVPKNWFADHFAHPTIWSFLQKLEIPVGCFHGEMDTMTSVDPVRALEAKAEKAGKESFEFHYFPKGEHTLRIGNYFVNGKLPAGHRAIFAFFDRVAPKLEKRAESQKKHQR